MGLGVLVLGLLLACAILIGSVKLPTALRPAAALLALAVFIGAAALSSIAYVGADEVGIRTKSALGAKLKDGKIIATSGEMGVQAEVLPPGWHLWQWPIVYSIKTVPLTEIRSDEVGLIETADGLPLPEGQLFAPEFGDAQFGQMLDAQHFLTAGKGYKGKQTSVLRPGKYRLNTELFKVRSVKQTEVMSGEVAVLKANFGTPPTLIVALPDSSGGQKERIVLAKPGEMGILAEPLRPGKYPLNTDAFTVTEIWTTEMVAHYTVGQAGNPVGSTANKDGSQHAPALEEREISVRTADGFTFPVDVRVSYKIDENSAPQVVALLGDDEGERFRNVVNSVVRAAFRNSAEGVRALDYVQQRSQQERQALTSISKELRPLGITVTGVNIGAVGNEQTLGALLKTQTDREIAKQELITTQEQQKAAEQKKQLTRTVQEAEEEKRLATAAYAVKIAAEEQKRKVTEATAEAEAIKIKALAQADAYRQIAEQIGKSNAALIEVLKIVGERQIQITPRIMVTGGGTGTGGAETTALIGTMLDTMVTRDEEKKEEKK